MTKVRPPAVAGLFYPADPTKLRQLVEQLLAAAAPKERSSGGERLRALVVPHAGYVYSGPVAAAGFARLQGLGAQIQRVVLIGPAHWVALRGVAVSSARAFQTPLGQVAVDTDASNRVAAQPRCRYHDTAHTPEHSLEVQLPFLQVLLADFCLVPLLVGEARPGDVAQIIARFWADSKTLVVVSTDLSHYHDYETARRLDTATTAAIEGLCPEAVTDRQACGHIALRGLLLAARRQGLRARTLDVRNSGDLTGDRRRVVGYGAYSFYDPVA